MYMWRCLRLSLLIKIFSEGVGKSIKWFVDFFKKASEKIVSVWGALARAKDVLGNCRGHVAECVWLRGNAISRDGELGNLSVKIRENMFKIVVLRNLIRHIAQEIKRRMRANIALMEAVMQKFKDINFVPDQLKDLVEDVEDGLEELRGKLVFWRKK